MGKVEDNKLQRLPGWIVVWFYVTTLVCTWDASFIVLRPHTLPGGKYAWLWDPYKYYITVEKRYQDVNDDFIFCQSLLNYAEVLIDIITLFLHHKRSSLTVCLAYTVCVMTLWKTVLYFLMYVCGDPVIRAGNTLMQELLLFVIPNGIWIILPLLAMCSLWSRINPGINSNRQAVPQASQRTKDE